MKYNEYAIHFKDVVINKLALNLLNAVILACADRVAQGKDLHIDQINVYSDGNLKDVIVDGKQLGRIK